MQPPTSQRKPPSRYAPTDSPGRRTAWPLLANGGRILAAFTLVFAILAPLQARSFVDMGTTSLLSGINQPYVQFQMRDGLAVLGPSPQRSSFLLDTGATSILTVGPAAQDLHDSAGDFDQGQFQEQGIGGFIPYRVSAPLTVHVEGDHGSASINNARILTDPGGSFGAGVSIDGIVGMPAMVGRVTSLGMGGSTGGDLGGLLSGLLGGGGLGGGDLGGLDWLLGDLGGGLGGGAQLLDLGQLLGGFDGGGGLDDLGLGQILGLGGGLDQLLGLGGGADQLLGLGGGAGLGLDQLGLGGLLGGLGGGVLDLGDLGVGLGGGLDLGDLGGLLGGTGINLASLSSVEVSFSDRLPTSNGHRYAVSVSPLSFNTAGLGLVPTVAPLPAVRALHVEGDNRVFGAHYAIDTGAQMSIISTATAKALGLDLANPDLSVPVSGVGGIILAPAFTVDRVGLMTEGGTELAWNDVQVLALDIDPSLDGVIGSDLLSSSSGQTGGLDLNNLLASSAGAIEDIHLDFRSLAEPQGSGTIYFDLNPQYDDVQTTPSPLQAGDANQDIRFDQLDIVQVLQRAKYLTGQPATWGDGDFNGAPGGQPGSPPIGDGVFDQQDIVASLRYGLYGAGPYDTVQAGGKAGDGQTSVGYDPRTGQLWVDAPAGVELTSINIDSAAGVFTGDAARNLGGSFDNDADANIFKATFGSSFGSLSFGNVALTGLAEQFLLDDLTVVGSLAGGGELGDVDLIYVPEPGALLLLGLGLLGLGVARTISCLPLGGSSLGEGRVGRGSGRGGWRAERV